MLITPLARFQTFRKNLNKLNLHWVEQPWLVAVLALVVLVQLKIDAQKIGWLKQPAMLQRHPLKLFMVCWLRLSKIDCSIKFVLNHSSFLFGIKNVFPWKFWLKRINPAFCCTHNVLFWLVCIFFSLSFISNALYIIYNYAIVII